METFHDEQQPPELPATHRAKVVATGWAAWGDLVLAALTHSKLLILIKQITLGEKEALWPFSGCFGDNRTMVFPFAR